MKKKKIKLTVEKKSPVSFFRFFFHQRKSNKTLSTILIKRKGKRVAKKEGC